MGVEEQTDPTDVRSTRQRPVFLWDKSETIGFAENSCETSSRLSLAAPELTGPFAFMKMQTASSDGEHMSPESKV